MTGDVTHLSAKPEDLEFLFSLLEVAFAPYVASTYGAWRREEQRRRFFASACPEAHQIVEWGGRRIGSLKVAWGAQEVRLHQIFLLPEFQKRGIDAMLYVSCYKRAVQEGYSWAELSWVLETNELMRRAAENLGAKPYKRYRIVEMPL